MSTRVMEVGTPKWTAPGGTMDIDIVHQQVKHLMENPLGVKWQVQGLGMLRTYINKGLRLHIWDSSLRTPGVSPLHTHPWSLYSRIIRGEMWNHRYQEVDQYSSSHPMEFNKVTITCGSEACTHGEPETVFLEGQHPELYCRGDSYHQKASEIHESLPTDGTVTLIQRFFDQKDEETAQVYWRGRGSWVDAKPRPATEDEVIQVLSRSLNTWF